MRAGRVWVGFSGGGAKRATDALRLEGVDYLLKPLDPEQVTDAVNRLLRHLRPFALGSFSSSGDHANEGSPNKTRFTGTANELLPVRDVDADQIRLLTRREVAAVLRRGSPHWGPTRRGEFFPF